MELYFRILTDLRLTVSDNLMDFTLNQATGYLNGPVRMDEDIHFTANPKLRQVNTGFNRKQHAWQNTVGFVGLQIIDMSSISMRFPAQTVAGSVTEFLSVTRCDNSFADNVIDLPSLKSFAVCQC